MISRQTVGHIGETQIIASNIDYAFIVQAVGQNFNMNRLERYLVICNSSRVKPIIVLVLSGMVVMSFFNALLMVLKYFSDPFDELPSIVFWIMGSLARVTWNDIFILAPVTLLGVVLFMIFRFRINILSLGDVQSKSLGMNPGLFRFLFIVTSSFIVAMTVATCGQIAWIGLIIPHMARTIAGPEHERMLPVTALLGALFLLGADDVARSVSTAEIPVGIITALTGAPIFGFLLYRNRGSGWI